MAREEENLKLVSIMYNYNKWQFDLINPYLGENILEMGCGIGNITQFLKNKKLVVGIDNNRKNLETIKKKFSNDNQFIFLNVDITKKEDLEKLKSYNFDTILCLNFLEHIEDDNACLNDLRNLVIDGGSLILLCPNYHYLLGTIDKSDNHYRRYSKKDLIIKLKNLGFDIKDVFYINILGILGWILHGKILKKEVHVKSHFRILDFFSPFLKNLEKLFKLPVGLSIVVVCVKKKR